MIECLCCTLLALVARLTAGVYQAKFSFLSKILVPLNVATIVLACVTGLLMIIKILFAIRESLRK